MLSKSGVEVGVFSSCARDFLRNRLIHNARTLGFLLSRRPFYNTSPISRPRAQLHKPQFRKAHGFQYAYYSFDHLTQETNQLVILPHRIGELTIRQPLGLWDKYESCFDWNPHGYCDRKRETLPSHDPVQVLFPSPASAYARRLQS